VKSLSEVAVETVDLKVDQLSLNMAIDSLLLEKGIAGSPSEIDHFRDTLRDQFVFSVRKRFAYEDLSRVSVMWPASWWQHVKQDLFPDWLKQKFPVQFRKVIYDARAYYPSVSLPDKRPVIRFQKVDLPTVSWDAAFDE
jgi:hypothetical protein